MTIIRLSPPERGTEPLAVQLELFPGTTTVNTADERGISLARARGCTSPGWWQFLAPLFTSFLDVVVDECREQDGDLILRLTYNDGTSYNEMAERIRASAARTCGACGGAPAALYRAHLAGTTRRVCAGCRERLRNGEAYLAIADDYWCLDGSRRNAPRERSGGTRTKQSGVGAGTALPIEPLAAPELRRLVTDIRAAMRTEIVGQTIDAGVSRLALLAACHVGGGLARGGRALILGPTGAGKSALVAAMVHALAAYDLPVVHIMCTDLNPAGWSGASSLVTLMSTAIGADSPTSTRAQRAIIILDELHHLIVARDATGNLAGFSKLIMSSLLGLTGHGTIQLEDGRSWSSQHALVIGLGAFTGLLDYRQPVTVRALEEAGVNVELANRLAVEIITVRAPSERETLAILREWPDLRSLIAMCTRLGYAVRIHDEAIRRAARVVQLGHDGSTLRTAGGWLVSAVRQGLMDALEQPDAREIIVTPDSLPIAPNATRAQPPGDPPEPPSEGRRGNAWKTR